MRIKPKPMRYKKKRFRRDIPCIRGRISRDEEIEALLKVFECVSREWRLSTSDARRLMGKPGISRFMKLKRRVPSAIHTVAERDLMSLIYISMVYFDLNSMFSRENAQAWVCNVPDSRFGTRPWGPISPLQHMLSGSRESIIEVYQYIQGIV
ncbi:MAG: hypothetical protein J5I92_15245 [Thiogranum sp.]|nr:hypothetical protein [Thiogranum sp.]